MIFDFLQPYTSPLQNLHFWGLSDIIQEFHVEKTFNDPPSARFSNMYLHIDLAKLKKHLKNQFLVKWEGSEVGGVGFWLISYSKSLSFHKKWKFSKKNNIFG